MTFLLDKMTHAILSLPKDDLRSPSAKTPEQKIVKLISKNYIDRFFDDLEGTSLCEDTQEQREVYFRLRLVVDQVSGMTDSYADQLYQRIG